MVSWRDTVARTLATGGFPEVLSVRNFHKPPAESGGNAGGSEASEVSSVLSVSGSVGQVTLQSIYLSISSSNSDPSTQWDVAGGQRFSGKHPEQPAKPTKPPNPVLTLDGPPDGPLSARLRAAPPPAGVPPEAWSRLIHDAERFTAGWAETASRLGWTWLDLVGCDRVKPWARVDRWGVLWLVAGNSIVAMTADAAVIELAGGIRQSYRRVKAAQGTVLPWSPSERQKDDQ